MFGGERWQSDGPLDFYNCVEMLFEQIGVTSLDLYEPPLFGDVIEHGLLPQRISLPEHIQIARRPFAHTVTIDGRGGPSPFHSGVCGGHFISHGQFSEFAAVSRSLLGCDCGFNQSLVLVPGRKGQPYAESRVMKNAGDRNERARAAETANVKAE